MTSAGSERDPLEQLADEFAQRLRRGERPTLTEYVELHPHLAGPIRELFPALVEMEQLRHAAGAAGFPCAGAAVQPEQLGDYRIVREVARGGMGIVYEAVQESLGRHVALKVLPFHGLITPNSLERFRREARAAARLHHTNIVPVFGVGEDNGICYYAMQFIRGQNLESVLHELKRIRGIPLSDGPERSAWAASAAQGLLTGHWAVPAPADQTSDEVLAHSPDHASGLDVPPVSAVPRDANAPPGVSSQSDLGSQSDAQYYGSVARVAIQVAEALEYAHEQGIVHRDIKPSNLLLDTHGTVWVTDFGLAKEQDSDELTRSGDIVGTLRYMAPERFDGQADARSDVYGLGATLYELVTLAPPFNGRDRAELLRQIASEQPRPPRQINRSIPVELETIVSKALEKQPAERYATAGAMAEDLRRYLEDRPILARRPTLLQKLHKWSRRHRAAVTTAGVSATLACILAVVILVASNLRIKRALQAQTHAKNQLGDALDANEQTLYFYRIALAHREWWANRVARADALLDECPERQRQWEWHYLKRLCHAEQVCFEGHAGDIVGAAAFSPDATHVLSVASEQIKLWVTATGETVLAIPVEAAQRVAFSPQANRLASPGRDNTAVIWDAATGTETLRLRGHAAAVNDVAYSPEGQTLATAGEDKTVKLWDAVSGDVELTLDGHGGPVRSVAFSPDGRRVASSSNDRTVRLWDATTGEQIHRFAIPTTKFWGVSRVAFSPDGRRLAAAYDDEVMVWDSETAEVLCRFRNGGNIIHCPAFSPDGHWLAVGSEDSTVRIWDTRSAHEAFCLRGHTKGVDSVAFSRDGRQLLSASNDGTVKVWAVPWEQDAGRLPVTGAGYCMSVAFSRDGRVLASAHQDMRARIWDPATQQELRVIPHTRRGSVVCVAFSKQGRLATGNGAVVRIWDPQSGQSLANCEGHTGIVARLAFSPTGNLLASAGGDTTVKLWDSTTGRELRTLHGHSALVTCVAFSPDGRRLASASDDQTVRLWDVATGDELRTLQGHTRQAQSVAFHPDGRTLASGAADSTVRVWDTETGELLHTYGAHVGVVADVAYSPDGRRLAAATGNGSIVIWDTQTGREALTLRGHDMTVKCVTFSPDGNLLASAALDGSIRIWNATPLVRPAGGERSLAAQPIPHDSAAAASE